MGEDELVFLFKFCIYSIVSLLHSADFPISTVPFSDAELNTKGQLPQALSLVDLQTIEIHPRAHLQSNSLFFFKGTILCSKDVLQYVRILSIKTHILQLPSASYASLMLVQVTQHSERTGRHQVWFLDLGICTPLSYLSTECLY